MQDLNHISFDQATISTFGCIIMTILGGFGQIDQITKIYRTKKTEKISSLMSIIMFTLFASYLVRGIVEHRIMYFMQGTIRATLFLPIIIGLIRFGNFSKENWGQIGLGLLLLVMMYTINVFRIPGFMLIMYAGLIGACHQANKLRKGNGQVSFPFYATMLASVSFQFWYGLHFHDPALWLPCGGFMILYSLILILMLRNRIQNTVTPP